MCALQGINHRTKVHTMNNDNVTTLDTTSATTTDTIVKGLISERTAADSRAQRTALAYMVDSAAQEKKLTNRYKRGVEKALADGDVKALSAMVEQAQAAGIDF